MTSSPLSGASRPCRGSGPPAAGAAWPKTGEGAEVAARLQTGDGGLAPVPREVVQALCAQRTSKAALPEPALQMARAATFLPATSAPRPPSGLDTPYLLHPQF